MVQGNWEDVGYSVGKQNALPLLMYSGLQTCLGCLQSGLEYGVCKRPLPPAFRGWCRRSENVNVALCKAKTFDFEPRFGDTELSRDADRIGQGSLRGNRSTLVDLVDLVDLVERRRRGAVVDLLAGILDLLRALDPMVPHEKLFADDLRSDIHPRDALDEFETGSDACSSVGILL